MFQVLHSSAGAGKTHALVRHYLAHCMATDRPSAYRQVLALTFTNKAATEMKERVVNYLERIAAGEKGSDQIDDVVQHLERTYHVDGNVIAERAKGVLHHMLHHWGDVAIGTIDSFIRRVVLPFARDLQLDHDLRMTTEEPYYRDRAVESLIAEAGIEPTLTDLLTEACLQLLHEERKWDPERSLRELGLELGKESAIEPLERLGSLQADQVLNLSRSLRAQVSEWRKKVNALGDKALRLLDNAGIQAHHVAHGKGGIHGYFVKLSNFGSRWDPPGPNTLKPLETGKWHSGNAGPEEINALDGLSNELTGLFQEAEQLRDNGLKAYLIQHAVGRDLLTSFTLHALDDHLRQVKDADGVTFFSDLTRKVAQVVKHEPVPFIHERVGERYHHYLIDEFQDTSLLQWNALLPLIDEALGSGGSALLVGDAKQAIYRWRNGEVRLFTGFPKIFGRNDDPVEMDRERTLERSYREIGSLDSNWRSAGTIIEFNNALFASLGKLLPPELGNVYRDHAQRTEKKGQGLVHIQCWEKERVGEEREEGMLDFTMACVKEALDDGYSPGDIAVLVRSGNMGRAVADRIIGNGHAVVSPDGLQLAGDPVVELLIDLLRSLHTGDATAAARVMQYQAMLEAKKEVVTVDPFRSEHGIVDPVAHVKRWMKEHGDPRLRTTLTALVTHLARELGLRPAEDAPVLTLLDEVHAYSTAHGQDLGGFLVHWERIGDRRSVTSPEHGRAVQVMTIHKAKGLQFPVVIVPNANMTSGGSHNERFWIDPGDAVPELPVALIRESSALRAIELKELQVENGLRLLDSLNLLYVAFTRPEQRLYALAPERGADLVTKGLLDLIMESGKDGLLVLGQRSAPWKETTIGSHGTLKEVAGTDALANLALRLEAPDEWDPADPDPYRRSGNAIHEILARITTAAGTAEAVNAALKEGLVTGTEADDLIRILVPLLASHDLRPWYGEGLTVKNEATLISADGKAHRPDRVVIQGEAIRVLDIKTGRRSDGHHDQVQRYMALLRELGHQHVEGALLYIPEGSLVTVVS